MIILSFWSHFCYLQAFFLKITQTLLVKIFFHIICIIAIWFRAFFKIQDNFQTLLFIFCNLICNPNHSPISVSRQHICNPCLTSDPFWVVFYIFFVVVINIKFHIKKLKPFCNFYWSHLRSYRVFWKCKVLVITFGNTSLSVEIFFLITPAKKSQKMTRKIYGNNWSQKRTILHHTLRILPFYV